jgi:hypothetical protein
MIDNGGQVHPHLHIKHFIAAHNNVSVPVYEIKDGMTLRDHFAGLALNGLISHGLSIVPTNNPKNPYEFNVSQHDVLATISYKFADAMIAERKKINEDRG